MHLFIKQKVLTIRDRFKVYGDDEQPKYDVEGKIISIGKKLRILKDEQEVARIEQEVLHLLAHYNFHIEGKGDFFAHDYQINSAAGEPIASISRRWIAIGDAYDIQIYKDEHELLVLCSVLAIDADNAATENVSTSITTD